MSPDYVNEVALGYDDIISLFTLLFGSPHLFMQMGGVEELRGQYGASGFYSVYDVQKQTLVIVVHEGDGCASVAQPTCSTDLKWTHSAIIICNILLKLINKLSSYLVNVFVHVCWHVKVNYQFNVDQVKPSAENTGADYHFILTVQKTLNQWWQNKTMK